MDMRSYIQQALSQFNDPNKLNTGMAIASTPVIDSAIYDIKKRMGKANDPVKDQVMALSQKAQMGQPLSEAEQEFINGYTKRNISNLAMAGSLGSSGTGNASREAITTLIGAKAKTKLPTIGKKAAEIAYDNYLQDLANRVTSGNFEKIYNIIKR